MYNDGNYNPVAAGGTTINDTKYSTSRNSSTRLYYRLHILNVGMSDVKKYRCQAAQNQVFYLKLDFLGMCSYKLVIFWQ